MAKKVYKSINELSTMLPPAFHYENQYEFGSVILERNPKAMFQGKPLEPKKRYSVKVAQPVNHYRTLKKILTQRGMKGVQEYVDSFKKIEVEVSND